MNRNYIKAKKYRKQAHIWTAAMALSFLLLDIVPLATWADNTLLPIPALMFTIAGLFLSAMCMYGVLRAQKYMMLYFFRYNKYCQNSNKKVNLQDQLILFNPSITRSIEKFIERDEQKHANSL